MVSGGILLLIILFAYLLCYMYIDSINRYNVTEVIPNYPEYNINIMVKPGICKMSDHNYIKCKYEYSPDQHLNNTLWCMPMEMYTLEQSK